MSKRTNWDIDKAREFVESNSDCKLISETYKNVGTKMEFRCGCGNYFETSLDKFRGRNKRQCNECGRKIMSERQRLPYEEVKQFIEVDSNSGCKLLSKTYTSAYQKLDIECACGNEFKVPWRHFKNSNQRQCPECGVEIRAIARRIPYEVVKETIETEGCKLLSTTYKTVTDKIKIECVCGKAYHTSFGLFRDYKMNRCRTCRSEETQTSRGEDRIRDWLQSNDIEFMEEYTFKGLKKSNKLRFDFAVINKQGNVKMLIEFDGKQHFGKGNFADDTDEMIMNYKSTLASDHRKNEYCFMNSIPLLRIHYNKYPMIERILENSLK